MSRGHGLCSAPPFRPRRGTAAAAPARAPPTTPPPSPAAAACSFLAELEMKLHLSAEDVGLYLQDHSARAQQRIPAAAKELLRTKVRQAGAGSRRPGCRLCCAMLASQLLEQTGCHSCSFAAHFCLTPLPQDDVASLRASAAAALRTLEDAGSGQAAAVVGQLAELDLVKRRMEDACSTLKVRDSVVVAAAVSNCSCLLQPVCSAVLNPHVNTSGHLLPTAPRLLSACPHPFALPCCRRQRACLPCSSRWTSTLPLATCGAWQTRWRACGAGWRWWATRWQSSAEGGWRLLAAPGLYC